MSFIFYEINNTNFIILNKKEALQVVEHTLIDF
jgi:hypothetical protein